MSISSLDETRSHFKLLDDCHMVPYGNARALDEFLSSRCTGGRDKPDVCAFICEAVHGSRLVFPPDGYLKEVRALCDKYDVVMIVDEIYLGFGRTGHWFAFEHEDIVPDIVCYSKTFGGGKSTIGGYTARKHIFMGAYGSTGDCMMHSSTFSGMSEECAGALAAINVIKKESLVECARQMGEYMGRKLVALKGKHPDKIKDVRGRGLLWGVELEPAVKPLEQIVSKIMPEKSPILSTLAGVVVLTELFHSFDILAYLGFTRRNLVVYSPALIITRDEIDRSVDALDRILSRNWISLGTSFAKRQVVGW
jgi:putrescine aminotransferase